MSFEFVSYIPTPGEKHNGIAAIKYKDKIILRFKIMPTKDGTNVYCVPASHKISDENGERYVPAFTLDSNSEKEEIEGLVKSNVKRATQGKQSVPKAIASTPLVYHNAPQMPSEPEQPDLPF